MTMAAKDEEQPASLQAEHSGDKRVSASLIPEISHEIKTPLTSMHSNNDIPAQVCVRLRTCLLSKVAAYPEGTAGVCAEILPILESAVNANRLAYDRKANLLVRLDTPPELLSPANQPKFHPSPSYCASTSREDKVMAKISKPVILIVDDEEMVVLSLRNLFHLQPDYQVIIHTSPLEALSASVNIPVDLVITDYLMPEMDGITFLSRFKEAQPQAIRILLTAYADKENTIRAINTVGLYQYVEKPWDNAMLLTVVKNGLEKRSLLRVLEAKISELDQAQNSLRSLKNELLKAFM